jgi:hypothetical protein
MDRCLNCNAAMNPKWGKCLACGLPINDKQIETMSLDAFSKSNLAVKIWSDLLGEEVYFCSDEKMVDKIKGEGLVCYLPHELKYLVAVKPTKDVVRKVHEIKALFGGSEISD